MKRKYHHLKLLKCVYFILALNLLLSISVDAQKNIIRFTMQTFVAAVKANNLQLKMAEQERAFIKESPKEAKAAFFPQINFEGNYQRNFNDQYMYFEFPDFNQMNSETGEIPTSVQKFSIGFNNNFQADLLLQQNLLSIQDIYALKAAQVHAKIGELEYEHKSIEIISQSKKMFLQTVLMEYIHQLNQASEQIAHDNYITTKIKYENSLVSEMDLLQSKIRWKNEIPKTRQSKRNFHILLNNLKTVSGLAVSDSILVEYGFKPSSEIPLNVGINEILENREDFQMLAKSIDLSKALLTHKKAAYLPSLSAQLGYTYMSSSNQWNLSENLNKPFYAGVKLSIPILSGGYRNTQVRKANIQYQLSKYKRDDAQQNISIEVQNLKMKVHEEYAIIISAQSTLETAQKGYELALKNTESGLMSQLDLRRYTEDLKRAQANLYFAIYNYECSLIDYHKAIGKNEENEN